MARRDTIKIVPDADFSTEFVRIPAEEFDPEKHERYDPDGGSSSTEVDATDGARALAGEEDVDLTSIEGSGKDGRITKADVKSAT
ncbi:E3 binding domain-containing protein [Salinibacter altiplanensis]|uniref:E3 binding domain-containing protein n=1 Tax=Salinibacter altiplanensis TaxID=1803181 RepID=UPI000C9F09C6|nr:E3 binding domain-containing protein [Salinibacter altiplanensis]